MVARISLSLSSSCFLISVDDTSILDAHHVDVCVFGVGEDGVDIDVVNAGADDGRLVLVFFEQTYLAADNLGFLEP